MAETPPYHVLAPLLGPQKGLAVCLLIGFPERMTLKVLQNSVIITKTTFSVKILAGKKTYTSSADKTIVWLISQLKSSLFRAN